MIQSICHLLCLYISIICLSYELNSNTITFLKTSIPLIFLLQLLQFFLVPPTFLTQHSFESLHHTSLLQNTLHFYACPSYNLSFQQVFLMVLLHTREHLGPQEGKRLTSAWVRGAWTSNSKAALPGGCRPVLHMLEEEGCLAVWLWEPQALSNHHSMLRSKLALSIQWTSFGDKAGQLSR